jgi:hypothetical protein
LAFRAADKPVEIADLLPASGRAILGGKQAGSGMQLPDRREPVRVEFHLSGGQTRVVYERVPQHGVDIPTSAIPYHLRPLGSRFVLVIPGNRPADPNEVDLDELRAAWAVRVEELNDG